jgi:hypothetical protein
MKDYTNIREIIETYLSETYDMSVIKYQNVRLDIDNPKEYISIEDEEIEDTEYHRGVLIITIYTELFIGTNRSREIATFLSSLIEGKEINGIVFEEGVLRNIGEDMENNYFVQQLFFDYYVEGGNCI